MEIAQLVDEMDSCLLVPRLYFHFHPTSIFLHHLKLLHVDMVLVSTHFLQVVCMDSLSRIPFISLSLRKKRGKRYPAV